MDPMLLALVTIHYMDSCVGFMVSLRNISGFVSLAPPVEDPTPDANNLFCKWTPGPRAYHGAVYFAVHEVTCYSNNFRIIVDLSQDLLYIFGGKQTETTLMADTWYRDATMPVTLFSKKPATNTPDSVFEYVPLLLVCMILF